MRVAQTMPLNCELVLDTAECLRVKDEFLGFPSDILADLLQSLIALQVLLHVKDCDALFNSLR